MVNMPLRTSYRDTATPFIAPVSASQATSSWHVFGMLVLLLQIWYVVPPSRAPSVERTLQSYLADRDPHYVLHSLTVQLPPSLFVENNIPVYRIEQHAKEFVMLWPRTYHAGFNAGYAGATSLELLLLYSCGCGCVSPWCGVDLLDVLPSALHLKHPSTCVVLGICVCFACVFFGIQV